MKAFILLLGDLWWGDSMLERVLIGLAIFSIVKVIIFIKLSDIFLSKKVKNDNDNIIEISDDVQIDESTKYKRDYFK